MIDARTITNMKLRIAIERRMTLQEANWYSTERRNARQRLSRHLGR